MRDPDFRVNLSSSVFQDIFLGGAHLPSMYHQLILTSPIQACLYVPSHGMIKGVGLILNVNDAILAQL